MRFLGADNSPLDVPIKNVEIPGEGPSITLPPGTNAFAGVKWEIGDKADTATRVATGIEMTPPGGTGSTFVDVIGLDGQPAQYAEFPIRSVKVGTLQPAAQGVLVFD
jgi:hypothetical protein